MTKYLNGQDIANEVIMIRQDFTGAIIILEGEGDAKVFEKFIRKDCEIQVAYGKKNTLEAIAILDEKKYIGILAIVDADFWHVDGVNAPSENIMETDFHDLEVMVFCSPAFNRVLKEYGSDWKISNYLKRQAHSNIRQALFKLALPIGIFRWLSLHREWNFYFNDIKYKTFVDRRLKVQLTKMVRYIRNRTSERNPGSCTVTETDSEIFETIAETIIEPPGAIEEVCCGHDVSALLAIGLRNLWGSETNKTASVVNIEKVLRLSYDAADFKTSQLYQRVKTWELRGSGYHVLLS